MTCYWTFYLQVVQTGESPGTEDRVHGVHDVGRFVETNFM